MGKEKGTESEKSEMEEGEMETQADDDIVAEDEVDEAGVAASVAEKELEDQSDREGEADSERKTKKKRKQQKKSTPRVVKEPEIAPERDVPKGSPRRKIVKEEPRETQEKNGPEDENSKPEENGKRDGKWKKADGRDRLVRPKSLAKRQNLDEEESQKSETEEDEEEVERGEEVDEDEKSEEVERKEAEKDLALTMSSSWAPLSERERETLKVTKSGREDRDREIETNREVQSEWLKEKGRAREDDVELSKDKSRQKKQKLSEPSLPFSLSLPDTSLHLASSDPGGHVSKSKSKSSGTVAKTSENDRSFKSFGPTQSQSNGYTNSLSLSLSHPFFHNASCSLTQNSADDKEGTTCASRQLSILKDDPTEGSRGSSFGVREQFFLVSEGSQDRSKHRRELPLYPRLLQPGNPQFLQGAPGNGDGTRDSSRSFMDERPMESIGNHVRGTEGSQGGQSQGNEQYRWKDEGSLASGGMDRSRTSQDRPWSIHKETRQRHRHEGWSSPSQSASFQDRRYDLHKLSDRERRPDAEAGRELSLSGSRGFVERDEESAGREKSVVVVEEDSTGVKQSKKVEQSWLHEIVTEPIPRMARKLQEVPDGFLESLKKCLEDSLGSTKRKDEFASLQRTLQRRSDLTTDTLRHCHRTQLEILVALKTGIAAFLHPNINTAALIEIFLGTKCRNVACQSQLPADDCECKVCSSKGGFCNACMCVVCSKFDFDADTCRWIGCDFCLHWCHSDCGIHMGHISSGIRSSGDSVMQFRCIGCDHTSELYGFVKDVFTMCAKDWSVEILARELQCVRRIFHRSEDLRGKQLFGKAEQLLVKLDSSRDVSAVCMSMMKFFNAGDEEVPSADLVRPALPLPREKEMTSQLADAVRDAIHVIKAPNCDGTDLEKALTALHYFDREVEEKRQEVSELDHERAWHKSQIEELENIVQNRQAEAKMFQMRADEVRREAEGLQRIVQAKIEKIEEEYKHKIIKLRLNEAEERRRKCSEEVRNMEKAQREYSAMKMSMVSDIRELLKKVEAAKAQLS